MAQPLPPLPSSGPVTESEPRRKTKDDPIIGGYATSGGTVQTSGSLAGGGTFQNVFQPYRQNDLRHILAQITQQGSILDLQLALVQAGLLDEDVAFGFIDGDTEDAFETVLTIANQNGMLWSDVLSQVSAGGGQFGGVDVGGGGGVGGGAGLAPTVITLPNRDDMVAAVDDLALSVAGERVDMDLQESLADQVLDVLRTHQERGVQREISAAESGRGGVLFTESAPDPARLLEEELREERPGLVMGKETREAMDEWMSLVRGPV